MASASVTSKGQVTIPIEIRKRFGIDSGVRVEFLENANGECVLRPKTGSIMDLYGVGKWDGPPVSIEEMNETIAKGWAGLLAEDEETDDRH
jgi:AbrB family looped-hinge helix DNA binding protein